MFEKLKNSRDILFVLAWKDIVSRYKQSVFGILWILVRPLALMLMLTFIFNSVANLGSGDIPYPLFVFSGLFCFEYFSSIVLRVSNSLLANKTLVSRVKCNRLLFPVSNLLIVLPELVLLTIGLLVLMLIYGQTFNLKILAMPIVVVAISLIAFTYGIILAVASVWYRDIKMAVSYVLQILLYLSPVGYATFNLEQGFGHFLIYNPIACLIDFARWSLFDSEFDFNRLILIFGFHVLLLALSLLLFRRANRVFADVI